MPNELKIKNLPSSYHYYDSVPILMAKFIREKEAGMEEEVIRKNISFRNSTQQPQKHII
jgi:hypothetical protein